MNRKKKEKLKYSIEIYCEGKRYKRLFSTKIYQQLWDKWYEYSTIKKPKFVKEYYGRAGDYGNRGQKVKFELLLIYPISKRTNPKPIYQRDNLGRLYEVKLKDERFYIKKIIPYWVEETVFDYENRKKLHYDSLIEKIINIKGIGQIFTLNNKFFVQIDDEIKVFGLKNTDDSNRLFQIIREDLINQGIGNFIFVPDISTQQRKTLYNLLEKKGFKRSELFRHYSY